jgi:hypothetical protein
MPLLAIPGCSPCSQPEGIGSQGFPAPCSSTRVRKLLIGVRLGQCGEKERGFASKKVADCVYSPQVFSSQLIVYKEESNEIYFVENMFIPGFFSTRVP